MSGEIKGEGASRPLLSSEWLPRGKFGREKYNKIKENKRKRDQIGSGHKPLIYVCNIKSTSYLVSWGVVLKWTK